MSDEIRALSFEAWEKKFMPLQEDGNEVWYETFESDSYENDYKALIEKATRFAGGDSKRAFLYIWTRLDGDDGDLYLTNGIRYVNRLDYCLTTLPWGELGEDGRCDSYFEINYS